MGMIRVDVKSKLIYNNLKNYLNSLQKDIDNMGIEMIFFRWKTFSENVLGKSLLGSKKQKRSVIERRY